MVCVCVFVLLFIEHNFRFMVIGMSRINCVCPGYGDGPGNMALGIVRSDAFDRGTLRALNIYSLHLIDNEDISPSRTYFRFGILDACHFSRNVADDEVRVCV